MTIELATYEDIHQLCNLENNTFGVNDFRLNARNFKYHIKKNHLYIAKEDDGFIAGYILFFVYQQSVRIYSLAVQENFRGRKIAQQLLLRVKQLTLTLQKVYISLEVRIDNINAIMLYSKMGFKKILILKHYYLDGTSGLKMKWKMDGADGGI
ncbi:MAG: N-acetyltransferase [Sulfurospirillaceae bacterium]|nr:N-acetyltransferase [Sulfurospirillaceae bacterium]